VDSPTKMYVIVNQPDQRTFDPDDNYKYSEGRVFVAKDNDGVPEYRGGFYVSNKSRESFMKLVIEPGTYVINWRFEW